MLKTQAIKPFYLNKHPPPPDIIIASVVLSTSGIGPANWRFTVATLQLYSLLPRRLTALSSYATLKG